MGDREEKTLNYYANLDPYLIREHNERLAQEVSAYRLEERLRCGGIVR